MTRLPPRKSQSAFGVANVSNCRSDAEDPNEMPDIFLRTKKMDYSFNLSSK